MKKKNHGRKRKHGTIQITGVNEYAQKPKKVRHIDPSCKHYYKGICLYKNDDCDTTKFCKNRTKPKTQLSSVNHLTTPKSISNINNPRKSVVRYSSPEPPEEIRIEDLSDEMPWLAIYGGYLLEDKSNLEDIKLTLSSMDKEKKYTIRVTYNKRTEEYFISKADLKQYYKRKMFFYARLGFADNDECSESLFGDYLTDDFDSFDQMSLLSMYGYKVGSTSNLTTEERRMIITFILDNDDRCSMYNLVELLEMNIKLREKREMYKVAVAQWREDYKFIWDRHLLSIQD